MEGSQQPQGLGKVRLFRFAFWALAIAYLPAAWMFLQVTQSAEAIGLFFFGWLFLIIVTVLAAALVKCPGCGNMFHTKGIAFRPFGSCLHCGLH